MSYVLDTDDENIISNIASPDVIPELINDLSSKDMTVWIPALRCVGNILTTDDTRIIESALFHSVLDKLA